MNITFNFDGEITVYYNNKNPKGYASKAAKKAFKDIRQDPAMRVYTEILGSPKKASIIINEDTIRWLFEIEDEF